MDDPHGIYTFPGHFESEYHGGIQDGMFQGDGTIKFRGGVHFIGKFDKGKAVEGYFEFSDGLRIEKDSWYYCDGEFNRLFKSEDEHGIKPAGRSQLTNQHPPRDIPEGMYDSGDGFYDPITRKLVDYDFVFLRNTDEKEHNWIVNCCRKAWDEAVGTKKIH